MNNDDEMIGKGMFPELDKLTERKSPISWTYEPAMIDTKTKTKIEQPKTGSVEEWSLARQDAEVWRAKYEQLEADYTKRIDDIKLKHEKEVKRLQTQIKINITEREYVQSLEIENRELQDAVIMLAKKLSQKDRVAELKQYIDKVTQNAKTREWIDDE